MLREIVSRFDPELINDLDKELKRKYDPYKPPSRNSILRELLIEFVQKLKRENDEAGR